MTLPEGLVSIGGHAFQSCSNLNNLKLPNSVTSIGTAAFQLCTGLSSITIPDSVTNLGDFAFSDCSGLTNVALPRGITSIGSGMFQFCTSLATSLLASSDLPVHKHRRRDTAPKETEGCAARWNGYGLIQFMKFESLLPGGS